MDPEQAEVWQYSAKKHREQQKVWLARAKESEAKGAISSAQALKIEAEKCRRLAEEYEKDLRDSGRKV